MLLAQLRRGTWLTPQRLRAYPALVLGVWLAAAAVWVALADGIVDPLGRPLGTDFMLFWSSSRLVQDGEAAAVYDVARLWQLQKAIAGADIPPYAVVYPPTALLLLAPLASLPYLASLLAWLGGTLAAFVATAWAWWPGRLAVWLAVSSPAVFVTVGHGQNAFLSASLLGAALLILPRRPVLAGVLVGLLAYKPQLAALVPLAWLAAGQWRAIAAAAATVLALVVASVAVFGLDSWHGFFAAGELARQVLEQGQARMVSPFAAVRLWHGGVGLAYAVQAVAAALAALAVVLVWRGSAPPHLKAAMLMAGAAMATPYLFDYDLVLLILPLLLVARDGVETGFLPWEKTLLAFVWAAPLLARPLALTVALPLGAAAVLVLFGVVANRAWRRRMAA